jgi:hypothetical protein
MAINKAEQWIQKIDNPRTAGGYGSGINKRAVERMQGAAEEVGEVRGTYIYVFKDGSGLYEKRRDDWYPADEELIAEALGRCSGCGGTEPDDCECDPHREDDEVTVNQ